MCVCFSKRAFLELIVYVVLFCGRTQCNRCLCKPEDVLSSPLRRDSFVVRIVCNAIEADWFSFLFSPSWDLFSNSENSCWGLDPLILGLSRWMLRQKRKCDNTGPHKVAEVHTPLEILTTQIA
uniref:Putative secreted protein n=1 Tax=Ixodes scapularis TaxID=6945 RepID=A0A4D5S0E6_IXOSC